ncbi:MAG TPA: hypothetical protein PLY70_02675 [Saprospiraceae bacterium]|nr:hypothetical protein [Saprospiraceae bacterium]HPN68745.1 hypothetical protein [Saprospiraceae bacterium]
MVATLPLLFILQLTANYESFTVQSPNNNVSAGLEATKWLDCTLVQILSSADIDQNILEEKISEIEFLEAASSFHTNENQVHLYSKDAEKTHFSDPFLTIGHQRLYDLYCAWKLDC